MTSEERFVLNAEWYDPQACITRPFFIQFYPFDGAIDIVSSTLPLTFAGSTISSKNVCF